MLHNECSEFHLRQDVQFFNYLSTAYFEMAAFLLGGKA
ncbi:hypothetical protein [Klebsiella pneumoniae ISC21]|nr:hypothetical protein [Klebsiella pneumoniae ISC21]